MENQYLLKLCMQSKSNMLEYLKSILMKVKAVDRVYYNIYRDEYRSSARFEDKTYMIPYKEDIAVKYLKKRLQGNFPFFFDVYGVHEKRESFTLVRTGRYTFLYVILENDNFKEQQKELFHLIDAMIWEDIVISGYCSCIEDANAWDYAVYAKAKALFHSAWQANRRLIYERYNTQDYDMKDESKRLQEELIWYPTGWTNWYNTNFLQPGKEALLMKNKEQLVSIEQQENSVKFQLYQFPETFITTENQEKSRNLRRYLANNKFLCHYR